jgi:hypothetical protein
MDARSPTLILIDNGCPRSISSGNRRTHSRRTILSQKDHRSV